MHDFFDFTGLDFFQATDFFATHFLWGSTVASLRVKLAKRGRFLAILQIVQIRKSITYVQSARSGRTNPSSSVHSFIIIFARSVSTPSHLR
ncbi:MAG: hypothetical protein DMG15_29025 [Acidobacteria bacterium]|nr:MAG: hypothetical protein DMG15_29025 [Acidobacteriota bacterium]